ncbi:hypothetical protein PV10_08595 [Exophiala mesophila]|uniref:Uncharacterized protein n=1 Tax=Exophiala mesophila TaxID=212818 RepID=A0A0D1WJA7_EXOME|nr:uncharacterized protein PV10_08595 [Exophiala mesophila]KIV88970.1 hypothetical protein PV10_08595 [Exophiala mesophila]
MASNPSTAYARILSTEEQTQDTFPVIELPAQDTDGLLASPSLRPLAEPTGPNADTETGDSTVLPIESDVQTQRPQPLEASPSHPAQVEHDELADDSRRRHSSLSTIKNRMYGSVDPSLHSLIEKDPRGTAREYNHRRQRRRLLRLTVGEWFNTLVLCSTYFGILYAYTRELTISVQQRRVFNSLTTANSLLLGVNLAASLRSYAKLMRWRMLAAVYRPLETFDLVMGCDSLLNVIKLLFNARSERSRFWPSRTQVYCVLWLLTHLAVTVLVGIIGLNYNLETSTKYVLLTKGTVSILSLDALLTDDYPASLAAVQNWGVRGVVTTPLDWNAEVEYAQAYYSDFAGHTRYYFQDHNPNDTSSGLITYRYIDSMSSCTGYRVTEGEYGNMPYIIYRDGDKDVNLTLPAQPGPGGLLVQSHLNSTCGDRCVDVTAFQAESYPSDTNLDDVYFVEQARYFTCSNNVSQAEERNKELTWEYMFSDEVARMLAGALGWSANGPSQDGKSLYAVYTNASDVRFASTPGTKDMANKLASFTIGAVSFMDDSFAADRRYVLSAERPIAAQYLEVTWRYAAAILASIPVIHCLTLLAVVTWANHAIIKDDSHLSIAKVYHSFLQGLGDHGCLLKGHEMVQALNNPKVKYGHSGSLGHEGYFHVDVYEQGGRLVGNDGTFLEGWYDGASDVRKRIEQPRRRYRDFDAREYF